MSRSVAGPASSTALLAWYASAAGVINDTHGKVVLAGRSARLTSVPLVACHRTQPPTAPQPPTRALLAFWADTRLLSA